MSNTRFIQLFLIAFFSLLLLIGAANYLIDPHGIHFHSRYEGFNKHKPAFIRYARIIKLYNADAIKPNGLFLGNSRTLYLAPEDAFSQYKPLNYYNFSLSSGRINEMNDLLTYSIRNYDIKYVCYGIDFINMTSLSKKYSPTFDRDLVSGNKSKLIEFIKLHTSIQAVEESFICVKENIIDPKGKRVNFHYNEYGSRTSKWRELNYKDLGDRWMQQQMDYALKTYDPIYNNPALSIPDYKKEVYISLLDKCDENRIEYSAYTNPLYKDQFEMLIKSKSYSLYKEYLRFLAENGGVWYFGGINEITSNRELYWDTQHPRKAMSYILSEIMFSSNHEQYTDELFGTHYTSENIDTLLLELDMLKSQLGAD